MKVRTGFVSNSSSSSFLVLLDERPKNVGHLRELIFSETSDWHTHNGRESHTEIHEKVWDPYDHASSFSTKEAAEYLGIPNEDEVCLLSKENSDNAVKFVAEALTSGGVEDKTLAIGYPDYPDTSYDTEEERAESQKKWEKFHKTEEKWATTHARFLVRMLLKQHEGKWLCRFRASDNDSRLGATVEHGETFMYCPFWLRFSQH